MTQELYAKEDGNEGLWQTIFAQGHPDLNKQHRTHTAMPGPPRCRLCLVPFTGVGGWWFAKKGKQPSSRNQHYCAACDGFLETFPGGAEVDMPVLFVDIRNSTAFADSARPSEVASRVTGFLDKATKIITDGDGFIMAFYGDCVVAVWPPGFVGPDASQKALAVAENLINADFSASDGPDVEIGVGLHRGDIYIGTVQAARGLFRDISIFGVTVNACARLAGAAGPGTALVSTTIHPAEGAKPYSLKGVAAPVEAISVSRRG